MRSLALAAGAALLLSLPLLHLCVEVGEPAARRPAPSRAHAPPACTLRVLDASGEPLANAQVTLRLLGSAGAEERCLRLDGAGCASLGPAPDAGSAWIVDAGGLQSGPARLGPRGVTLRLFAAASPRVKAPSAEEAPAPPARGAPLESATPAEGELSVLVTDGAGEPLEGAFVQAGEREEASDRNGRALSRHALGPLEVSVEAPDGRVQRASVNLAPGRTELRLSFPTPAETGALEVLVDGPAREVELHGPSGTRCVAVHAGRALVEELSPGAWTLSAHAEGARGEASARVVAGEVARTRLGLERTGWIEGQVLPPGAEVRVEAAGGEVRYAQSDARGRLRVEARGHVLLRAQAEGYAPQRRSLHVRAGSGTPLDLELAAGVSLRVDVSAAGSPAYGTLYAWRLDAEGPERAQAEPFDGTATLSLPAPGRYRLRCAGREREVEVPATGAHLAWSLPAGEASPSAPTAPLRGRVLGAGELEVALLTASGRALGRTRCDAEGRFVLDDALPRDEVCVVRVATPGWTGEAGVLTALDASPRSVEFSARRASLASLSLAGSFARAELVRAGDAPQRLQEGAWEGTPGRARLRVGFAADPANLWRVSRSLDLEGARHERVEPARGLAHLATLADPALTLRGQGVEAELEGRVLLRDLPAGDYVLSREGVALQRLRLDVGWNRPELP